MTQLATDLAKFQWSPQPEATGLLSELLQLFIDDCPDACGFAAQLARETGTRWFDWIDHLAIDSGGDIKAQLRNAGFVNTHENVWQHTQGLFPSVLCRADPVWRLAIKVECVADFLVSN